MGASLIIYSGIGYVQTRRFRTWPHSQGVKTSPFHGEDMGSSPVAATMSKRKIRKAKPDVPWYEWLDRDGCWFCKNKNGCGSCKANKRFLKERGIQRKYKGKPSRIGDTDDLT